MSTVITVTPAIDEADRTLRECGDETRWPRGREARFQLEWAKASLAEALDAHARLLGPYAPHCEAQDAAIAAAVATVEDTSAHLQKVHAEYQRRDAARSAVPAGEVA